MESDILCEPNGLGDPLTVVDRSSTNGSLRRFLLHNRNRRVRSYRVCSVKRGVDYSFIAPGAVVYIVVIVGRIV